MVAGVVMVLDIAGLLLVGYGFPLSLRLLAQPDEGAQSRTAREEFTIGVVVRHYVPGRLLPQNDVVSTRSSQLVAALLLAVALAEGVILAAAGVASGLSLGELLDGFAITNGIIGLSLAVAGWPVASRRPQNPVGWLLLGAGICYTTSAAGYALLAAGASPESDEPLWRLLGTVTNGAWTWAISLLLPLCLIVFPDGRLLSRRWRWVVVVAAVNSLIFFAMAEITPDTLSGSLGVTGYLTVPGSPKVGWVAAVNALASIVVLAAGVVALVLRYRRGDDRVRRQLLWLLLSAMIVLVASVVSELLQADSLVPILAVTLLPIAVMIAILRHHLLDIRLVVSRSMLYLTLTALVVAGYVGIVTVFDATVRRTVGLGTSVVATLFVAAAFNPVRLWLQRHIDRAFYGERHDPVRAIARVGARLEEAGVEGSPGLTGVLQVLCQVMRLPSATITSGGVEVASHGTPPALRQSVALRQGGELVGELSVGVRRGESALDSADERVIRLLSAPLAVAVHAVLLAADLSRAREALVTAREEERRRLRRDLHDGLGPVLTGVVLKADAARRLASDEAPQVKELLADLRAQTTAAIDDIRRLVHELRPPALDGLGLLGALRERATTLARRSDGMPLRVRIDATEPLPPLPAAIEVAAYRIATEALTNVSRHSLASAATVTLEVSSGHFTLTIRDNGRPNGEWTAGVGLTSMRERAGELGGRCQAGPGPDGGAVLVAIPLAVQR